MGILERSEYSRIIDSTGLEAGEVWPEETLTVGRCLNLSDTLLQDLGGNFRNIPL